MRFAIIENSIVINVIEKETDDNIEDFIPSGATYINITGMSPEPGKGWSYDGQTFSDQSSSPPPLFDTEAAADALIAGMDLTKLKNDELSQAVLAILYKLKLVTQEVT